MFRSRPLFSLGPTDDAIEAIAFAAQAGGPLMAISCSNDTLLLLRYHPTGQPTLHPTLSSIAVPNTSRIVALALSPCGRWLLAAQEKAVLLRIYTPALLQQAGTIPKKTRAPFPDLYTYIQGKEDVGLEAQTVRSYRLTNRTAETITEVLYWKSFSERSYAIVATLNGKLRIIDLDTGKKTECSIQLGISRLELVLDTTQRAQSLLIRAMNGNYYLLHLESTIDPDDPSSELLSFPQDNASKRVFLPVPITRFPIGCHLSVQHLDHGPVLAVAHPNAHTELYSFHPLSANPLLSIALPPSVYRGVCLAFSYVISSGDTNTVDVVSHREGNKVLASFSFDTYLCGAFHPPRSKWLYVWTPKEICVVAPDHNESLAPHTTRRREENKRLLRDGNAEEASERALAFESSLGQCLLYAIEARQANTASAILASALEKGSFKEEHIAALAGVYRYLDSTAP